MWKILHVNVFPAPSVNVLMISNFNNARYEIIDIKGAVILQGFVSDKNAIEVSTLDQGSYFVRLQKEDAVAQRTFIKL